MKARHEFSSDEDYAKYLRTHFAAMCLQGMLANSSIYNSIPKTKEMLTEAGEIYALAAVEQADELLKKLEK